jgi:hypothetical protein
LFFFHFKVYFFNYCNKLSIIHSFLLRIIFDHAEGVLYTWIKKNICTVSSSVIDSSLIRGMSYFEGDNLLVFYYLNTSNIWPDNRGGLWWEGSYKRGLLYCYNKDFLKCQKKVVECALYINVCYSQPYTVQCWPIFISTWTFLAHLAKGNVSFCHHLASVVRHSSSVNFSHFNLLLWNRKANWSETW